MVLQCKFMKNFTNKEKTILIKSNSNQSKDFVITDEEAFTKLFEELKNLKPIQKQ
jgi:hypothetical protein